MIEDYYIYIFSSLFAALGFITRYIWEFIISRRRRELTEKINKIEFKLKEFYYPIFFYLKREQIIWEKILKLHKNPIPKTPVCVPQSKKALAESYQSIFDRENYSCQDNEYSVINSSYDVSENNFINNSIIDVSNSYQKKYEKNYDISKNIEPSTNIDISNTSIKNLKLRRTRELNLIKREDSKYTKKQNSSFVRRESSIHLDIIKGLDEENLKIHKAVQDLIHEKMCLAVPPKELIALFLQYDEHVTVYQILRQMEIYDKFPVNYGTPYPEDLMQKIDERINYLNKQYQKYNKRLG